MTAVADGIGAEGFSAPFCRKGGAGMRVVPMAQEHIPALVALESACFAVPWSAAALAEELENPHAAFQVAVDETGRVLGYVGLYCVADEGQIANVAVAPAARRQGVARALLAALARLARERGLSRLTLEVRVSNAPAVALYEGAGFVRDGVRPGFYRQPREDAAIYSRYYAKV